jgi:glyoxylase-like metal-dependent hydrolase (beta-lactamase superfamily II)
MCVTVEVAITRCGFCRERAWFVDRSSFFRMIRFPAMIAVIRHPRLGVVLFDTGYGRALETAPSARLYRLLLHFELPEGESVRARMSQLAVPQVDLIFLSHFHPDHIGGLREVSGSAPILHSRDGLTRLASLKGMKRRRSVFFRELLPEDFEQRALAIEDLPVSSAGLPFHEGRDLAGDGSLVAVSLPGHAAGQYGLLCRLPNNRRILLCADAAWLRTGIVENPRPTWAARMIADDSKALTRTLAKLHEFSLLHSDVQIIPSHCEQSIAAYVEQQA